MASSRNSKNLHSDRCRWGCRGKGTLIHCWWSTWTSTTIMEDRIDIHHKSENRCTTHSSLSTFPGVKPAYESVICNPLFITVQLTQAKTGNQPINWWLDKETMTYIHYGILTPWSLKTKKVLSLIIKRKQLETMTLREINQSPKDTQHVFPDVW